MMVADLADDTRPAGRKGTDEASGGPIVEPSAAMLLLALFAWLFPIVLAAQTWVDPSLRFWPVLVTAFALALVWVVAMSRTPRLLVDDFEATPAGERSGAGAEFAEMLRGELLELVRGDPTQGPQLVRGEVSGVAIRARLGSLVPDRGRWVDGVVRVMRCVEPCRRLVLGGRLHVDDSGRLGVTMQLRRGGRPIVRETLRLSELRLPPDQEAEGAAAELPALAEAAAIWLVYHLPDGGSARAFGMLGTTDWRAYALFRLAHRRRPPHRAATFALALGHDPDLAAALSNLGTEMLWAGESTAELQRARRLLERAYEITTSRPTRQGDPTPFAAMYSLSAVHDALDDHVRASKYAGELVASLERVRGSIEAEAELKAYVERVRPCAQILLATVSGDFVELARLTKNELFSRSARVQYSLACAWSSVARRDAAGRTEAEKRSILHLSRSVALAEGPRRWARRDRTLEWVRTSKSTADAFATLMDAAPHGMASGPLAGTATLRRLIAEARSLTARAVYGDDLAALPTSFPVPGLVDH